MELFAFTQIAVNYEAPLPQVKRPLVASLPSSNWIGMATLAVSLSLVLAVPGAIALVQRGDRGADVESLQTELQKAGYPVGGIDGIFGAGTENAVRAFQAEHDLVADGVAGDITLGKLAEVNAGTSTTSSASSSTSETSSATDSSTTTTSLLQEGDSGAEVETLQRELAEKGYFTSSTFGVYGPVTKAAVEAFQAKNGLGVDGVAGPVTQDRLYSDEAIASNGLSLSSPGTPDEDDTADSVPVSRVFALGDSADAIAVFQNRLKDLGYFPDTVTSSGYFGPVTAEAVKAFQQANSLTVDGIAGPATQARIRSENAIRNGGQSTTEPESDTDDVSPSLLVLGDQGNAVIAVQDRLADLGYFDASSTGYYGPITVEAVKAFQRANGLTVDGITGSTTLSTLKSDSAVEASSTPVPAEPAPAASAPTVSAPESEATPVADRSVSSGSVVTVTADSGLNVRTSPFSTATIDRTLDDGTSVEVSGEQVRNWIELSEASGGGWVDSSFVFIPAS